MALSASTDTAFDATLQKTRGREKDFVKSEGPAPQTINKGNSS